MSRNNDTENGSSAGKRKVVRSKARGEFVWVMDGTFGQYPAQLIIPTSENPPQNLDDTEMIEVRYTTSGLYDWVENQHIEYPDTNTSKVETTTANGRSSRRSTKRNRKGQDTPDNTTNSDPPSGKRSNDKNHEGSTSYQDEDDEGKLPANKGRPRESSVSIKRKEEVVVMMAEEEPGAINSKGGGQKKKSFANVTGYYKENPSSNKKGKSPERSEKTKRKQVVEDNNEELSKETTERREHSPQIQSVVEDKDIQESGIEEPPTKRRRNDGVDGSMFSTLNSLAGPFIDAGRFIYNGLFGKP